MPNKVELNTGDKESHNPSTISDRNKRLKACAFCKKEDHLIASCPKIKCGRCNVKGHTSGSCETKNEDISCNFCRGTGHTIDTCVEVKCRGCNKRGHPDWSCENELCSRCGFKNHTTARCFYNDEAIENINQRRTDYKLSQGVNIKTKSDNKEIRVEDKSFDIKSFNDFPMLA